MTLLLGPLASAQQPGGAAGSNGTSTQPAAVTSTSGASRVTEATRPASPMLPARGPSLQLALEAAQAALTLCHAQGHDIGVVVADSAGGPKVALFADTRSTQLFSFAMRKIATALEFKLSSADVQALAATDKAVADRLAANSNLMAVPGGVLLKSGDEIVGAIGGTGARSVEDAVCAQAGADKIRARL